MACEASASADGVLGVTGFAYRGYIRLYWDNGK